MSEQLTTILGLLPKLSRAELSHVVALTQSLQLAVVGSNRAGWKKSSKPSKKGEDKSGSNPARRVSKFNKLPEYRAYKKADKLLKAFLKDSGKKLSDFVARGSNEITETTPSVVADFLKVRQCWFRVKIDLQSKEFEDALRMETESPAVQNKSGGAE
jgi:hypothetical protein